jgi:predicted RNA-binding protein YlqC (UPF0109 family)
MLRMKRGHDEIRTDYKDKKSKIGEDGVANVHEVRLAIDSRQVGSVIGRAGSNVTRIRLECSVFISILGAPEGVKDRILTIKGTSEAIALACHHISEILIEAQLARAQKAGDEKLEDNVAVIRFLVHSSLVGGIIGKSTFIEYLVSFFVHKFQLYFFEGGALVQSTQSSTGARVQVSTEPLQGVLFV